MTRHRTAPHRRADDERGLALLAVLVALSILLALAAPFLISMGNGAEVARQLGAETKAGLASESVRDLLLQAAARSESTYDLTPDADGLDEYPSGVVLPEGFEGLKSRGRTVLGGEVEDMQRRFALEGVTPLTLANLVRAASTTAREFGSDDDELRVLDTSGFPEQGMLFVNHEAIRYGAKTGSTFQDLTRGLLVDLGFRLPEEHTVGDGSLVLDMRCVFGAALPFLRDGDPTTRGPLLDPRDLAEVEDLGFEPFTVEELGRFARFTTARGFASEATTWGRGERVFEFVENPRQQIVAVRTRRSGGISGGQLVRLRSLDGELVEYNLVWDASPSGNAGAYNLGQTDVLGFVFPVALPFVVAETVVEPLVPVPVNVNTAEREVLTAMFANLSAAARVADQTGGARTVETSNTYAEAEALAQDLIALRDPEAEGAGGGGFSSGFDDDELRAGPFRSLEDFIRRYWRTKLETEDPGEREFARRVLRMLIHGQSLSLRMNTTGITFTSSPLVRYRAAAARNRVSGIEDARVERSGFALAMPERELFAGALTQRQFEEWTRFDRHSGWWTSGPIYVGVKTGTVEPPLRAFAMGDPYAFPDLGLGSPRFPDAGEQQATFRPSPASTPLVPRDGRYTIDNQFLSDNPDGRLVGQQGVTVITNSGPSPSGGAGSGGGASGVQRTFEFTEGAGLVSRQATSAWFRLDDLGDQGLIELAGIEGSADRNRISVELIAGELVLQVFDEAGLDPDPSLSDTQPQIPVGLWRVPVADIGLAARDWVHISAGVSGTRPDQLDLLIDGVPRGRRSYRTVTTQALGSFMPNNNIYDTDPLSDSARYVDLQVEDASTFPLRGVVRVGNELLEYTARTDSSLRVVYDDSFGGRMARVGFSAEFENPLPGTQVDPELAGNLFATSNSAEVPGHPSGASVELYGYSLPVYPRQAELLKQGEFGLRDALGAFCVARVVNSGGDGAQITSAPNQSGVPLGVGLPADPQQFDLVLADPVLEESQPPNQLMAQQLVLDAFPQNGGYVMLCQQARSFTSGGFLGGKEVIRYSSRSGNRLQGVERGIDLGIGNLNNFPGQAQAGLTSNFVTDWEIRGPMNEDLDFFNSMYCYAVPISVPLLNPPPVSDHVEWLQIREPNGNDNDTEWVQYHRVLGSDVVCASPFLLEQCRLSLVRLDPGASSVQQPPGGVGQLQNVVGIAVITFNQPFDDGQARVGFTDPLETQFPAAFAARTSLAFRGDPFTNTTSHPHTANAQVLPVHRFEFNWRESGVRAARAGRLDRVALVSGEQRRVGNPGPVEWHTVNWVAREYGWQQSLTLDGTQAEGSVRGIFPFQLVALQAPVNQNYIASRAAPSSDSAPFDDVRLLDRMVKFPSGELPAEETTEATYGGGPVGGAQNQRGFVDENAAMSRSALPRLLASEIPASGLRDFTVRVDLTPTSVGTLIQSRVPAQWRIVGTGAFPENGGMVRVGAELIAFETFDPSTGNFSMAEDGRGMLGTEPQAHAVGEEVRFIDEIPTAILVDGIVPADHEFGVRSLGGLPREAGTVLINRTELAHYTWSAGDQLLGMPPYPPPPEDASVEGQEGGLFRGRYGTVPTSAGAGAPLVWMPFRYWDRYVEGSDDPECSFYQATINRGPVLMTGFGWREQNDDELYDLRAQVRFDSRGDWRIANGYDVIGFEDGGPGDGEDGELHSLDRAAARIEMRFGVVYENGAFDPGLFRAHAWKRAPELQTVLLRFEGETRVLEEVVTAR